MNDNSCGVNQDVSDGVAAVRPLHYELAALTYEA